MRRYDDDDRDDLSPAIDDLYALLTAVLRRPRCKALSSGGAPPPLAGLAGLLLGASLTLVIGGSLLLVIGVVLMPVVVAVILAGIFSTISERGRGIISSTKMPHKSAMGLKNVHAEDLQGDNVLVVWDKWMKKSAVQGRSSGLADLVACWWMNWKTRNNIIFRNHQLDSILVVQRLKLLLSGNELL